MIFLVTIEFQSLSVAKANFKPYPSSPGAIEIAVQSPIRNRVYTSNNISLVFTLEMTNLGSTGSIDEVTCNLDGKIIPPSEITFTILPWKWTTNLTLLSEGWHNLSIKIKCTSVYWPYSADYPPPPNSDPYALIVSVPVSDFASVDFCVDAIPPNITVLSPQNKTYTTTDVPLNFTISDLTAWIRYDLDEEINETISGNTTLNGLSYGSHNLTVYALDIVGRVFTFEPVLFNVTREAEQHMATQPELSPALLVAGASGILTIVIVSASVIYYKKKKRENDLVPVQFCLQLLDNSLFNHRSRQDDYFRHFRVF